MNLKQKINSLFIACILVVLSAATALAAPDVSADAAIVIDRNSGAVLYEKNPDKREYPASMTKMMTCILALENSKPDRIVEEVPMRLMWSVLVFTQDISCAWRIF